jgi:hypothetical protein
MDTARQILRYSIPGSLLLLHALACYLVFRRFQGASFSEGSNSLRENIGALVAILATVPIGFVVYQAYYFSYAPVIEPWPGRWGGKFVRADRGWQVLRSLAPSQVWALQKIFATEIDTKDPHRPIERPKSLFKEPCKAVMHWLGLLELTGPMADLPMGQRQEAYQRRWYANWGVLRSIVDIAGAVPESSQIKSEYTTLSDIYHALGAARTAVTIAWVVIVGVSIPHLQRISAEPLGSLAGLLAISAMTLALGLILHFARNQTWKSASAALRLGLRWLFWRHASEFVPDDDEYPDSQRIREALRSPALFDDEPPGSIHSD